MNLDKNTTRLLRRLSENDQFDYFFEKVGEKPNDEVAEELINELASLIVTEFNLPWDNFDKAKFFLWLGYHAHR